MSQIDSARGVFFFEFSPHGGTPNVLRALPICHRRTEGSEAAACSGDLPSRAAKKKRRRKAHINGSERRMEGQGQTGRTTPHATRTSLSVSFIESASVAEKQTNKKRASRVERGTNREEERGTRGSGRRHVGVPFGTFNPVLRRETAPQRPSAYSYAPQWLQEKKHTRKHTHRHT